MKQDYKKKVQIVLFPVIVFALNQLVNMPLDLFIAFPWLDIPMHLIGGASIGVSAVLLWRYKQGDSKMTEVNRYFLLLWTIGMVSFVAILWEFYEFAADYFFHTAWQLGAADMIKDLFFGLAGGCVAGWYMIRRSDHGRK